MHSSLARRVSVPIALVLSLAIAADAFALTWGPPVPLSGSSETFGGDIAAAGSIAVAAYPVGDAMPTLYARRTTDSGMTWKLPVVLSNDGRFPAVAGYGSSFDVIWNSSSGRLRYARSTDGGASFSASVALSPLGRYTWRPAVARGPNGVVAVVWEDVASGAIKVRVSTDGGANFAAAMTLATAGDEMGVGVAIGTGVIYVGYSTSFESLRLKRSTNNGASWSSAVAIADDMTDDGISLTAAGSRAFIAYTAMNNYPQFSKVRYRGTTDKGSQWSPRKDLAASTWTTSDPDINLAGGVLRAAFVRCTTFGDYCDEFRVFYRQRVLGSSWEAAQRVSPSTLYDASWPHVAYTGKTLVYYTGEDRPYVRVGTP